MAGTEEKRVVRVYALLTAALLLMLVPHLAVAVIALVMLGAAQIMAYRLRRGADENSLSAEHAGFIIRTIWMGCLIAAITTVMALAYLLRAADSTPLQDCAAKLADMVASLSQPAPDTMTMVRTVEPCIHPYVTANMAVFINALLIAALLPMVYFGYRMAKGLNRALRGHRLGNVSKWF